MTSSILRRSAWTRRSLAIGTLAATTLCGALPAQETAAPADTTFYSSWRAVEPSTEVRVVDGVVQLGLDEAILLALSQNLGLQIQRFQRAQSLFTVMERSSIYDLATGATLNTSEETSPSASQLDGADIQQSETQFLGLTLDQLVPTGGTASLDWQNVRRESNSIFSQINPSYSINFDLLFSQPLLRGFGRENTERGLRLARIDDSISLENMEIRIADTVQQVSDAYWALVEAREQLKVSEEGLELAQRLHEMNRVQVDVGTMAPLELLTSEAGIADREEEIVRNRALVDDAADLLRQLLNVQQGDAWLLPIEPTTSPETERIEIDVPESIGVAMRERHELRIDQLALEKLELDQRFFHNQKLPDLRLNLRYGFNGLGGDIRVLSEGEDPFNPNPEAMIVSGGYSDAWDQIVEGDFEGWSVGLNFSYPIQNRSARALSTIADLALEEGRLSYAQTELDIRTAVRRSARAVLTAAEQIDSANASRRLQEEVLDAEGKKYENGLSTSFQVLEIQEDLSSARSREVSAIANYRRALTAYYRAIGRLLEENGIQLEDETDLEALTPE